MAAALDRWWDDLGRPDPFTVVEAGAGVATLARTVLAADPECGSVLRYLLVERAPALRARHGDHLHLVHPAFAFSPGAGPLVVSLAELPAVRVSGVVMANELLDNLAFDLVERSQRGWSEVRVGLTEGRLPLVEQLVPATIEVAERCDRRAPDAPVGGRLPVQDAAATWLRAALGLLVGGRVVVVDYADDSPSLAARPWTEWVRTYRAHARGDHPLTDLGGQDVTCEVALDQLARVRPVHHDRSQADFLAAHGLDRLVEEGRRVWAERAGQADLDAVRGRSRATEAAALTDPAGLGAFRVLEWSVP